MPSARTGLDVVASEAAVGGDLNAPAPETLGVEAGNVSISEDVKALLGDAARALGVPLALLSRDRAGWQFEAEAFPPRPIADAPRFRGPTSDSLLTSGELTDRAGLHWTGLLAGSFRGREWLLMLPGTADRWSSSASLEGVVARFRRGLDSAVRLDEDRRLATLHRRLFAFVRRLTRSATPVQTHRRILQAIANEVGAETGAFALYDESERSLTITATLGYPLAIVEHLRLVPGEGIIGEAFASGRAVIARADEQVRRLRYRSDSFMIIPLVASGRCLAVLALTDRADGRPFDSRDLRSARLLAAPAVLALERHRVSASFDDLTRAATVDPVTGLFNRRYFQTHVQAEVQRARRQKQDLALLMVDIDDFKRINDTLGHLEGDRALREVADLLRRGVRIFDLCARYGGEEFAIVMPGATREMAVQVAERIRRGIAERSGLTPLPMTVSVGVGFLGADQGEEALIDAADRALMAAKRAGKNVVKTEEP